MKIESWAARALLALALVLLGVRTASADLPAGGTVFLDLGPVDQFRWVKPDNSTVTESISDLRDSTGLSKDACKLALGTPALMTLTSQGKTVGFNNQKNWIGVREQSKGVDCGRLVLGQTLTLALGPELSGYSVRHMELELNAKKNAVIRAVLSLAGQTQTFTLKTGLSATGQPGPNEQFCNEGVSDSNPDSAANCRLVVDAHWEKVTFFTDAGEWSLAGGTLPSEFELVQFSGVLGCPTIGNQNIEEVQGPNGLTSSGYRVENVFDPELPNEPVPACVVVPYSYSRTCPAGVLDAVCVSFIYEFLDQGTHMAFFFESQWPPEPVPENGGIDAIPETLQLFINGSTTAIELNLCPEIRPLFDDPNQTPEDPTDDVFVGLDPAFPIADREPTVPGTQAGCLITREVIQVPPQPAQITEEQEVPPSSEAVVIEGYYVQGDYTAFRGVR